MAVVGQQLLAPESGWRRYDANVGLIGRVGDSYESSEGVNAYGGTLHYYNNTSSYPIIKFYGTKFRIIALKTFSASNASSNVAVEIDGSDAGSFSVVSTSHQQQMLVFESLNLTKDYHTVKITAMNGSFWFDAIDIDEDGELIRHDYFDNLLYDEPMRKYGVAWFGFDEASGNVYDKLGSNYVGTVTGATRASGWNGEGSALEFGGSSRKVDFNNPVFPIGEKTIRVKIKSNVNNSVSGRISATSDWTKVGEGLFLYEGKICYWVTPTNSSGTTHYSVNYFSSIIVADGKYHDVIVSMTSKYLEIYIDGVLDSRFIFTPASRHTYNLLMGVDRTSAPNFYTGLVDDLQIYSKALTPSDFTQNRVAIKTTDNKAITLPSGKGRVKELPTAEEVDLINQGYTWREIDNAVDSTRYDLTQATTEYEIVSKSHSSLGAGKVFTLPIKEEFKTVKIENNY